MTLPPASANRSRILALTSGGAPQPQSSPKVMVPSATSEIRTPDLPKSRHLMRFPHFFGWATPGAGGQLAPEAVGRPLRMRARRVAVEYRGLRGAGRFGISRQRGA